MPSVEERVDRVESVLGQFIVHTDVALRRLEERFEFFPEYRDRELTVICRKYNIPRGGDKICKGVSICSVGGNGNTWTYSTLIE